MQKSLDEEIEFQKLIYVRVTQIYELKPVIFQVINYLKATVSVVNKIVLPFKGDSNRLIKP